MTHCESDMRFEVQPDDTVANGKVWFKIDSTWGIPHTCPMA